MSFLKSVSSRKRLLSALMLAIAFSISGCGGSGSPSVVSPPIDSRHVSIVNKNTHYEVTLDYSSGVTHNQMGKEYGAAMKIALPEIETIIDSYLKWAVDYAANKAGTPSQLLYSGLIARANKVKSQIPAEYRDEIDGIASQFSGGNSNVSGDGKLSVAELYLANLAPDILRSAQCSAVAVYGTRSATGETIVGRNLDWFDESLQTSKIHAVVKIKNGINSVCLVGFLGFMGIISGFNDNGVFAAILDSSTGEAYPGENFFSGKRSYPMDLRYALENNATLDTVADYMKDYGKQYTFNHLIFLADSNESKVLENNLGNNRELRTSSSTLNPGIQWGISNAVGAVNCFMLSGNDDNYHGQTWNTARWASLKSELEAKGDSVTVDELKSVISFNNGDGAGYPETGDLYNGGTMQTIIFEPGSNSLQIAFRPKSIPFAQMPIDLTSYFEQIEVSF